MEIIFKDTGKIRFDKWLAFNFPEKSREFFNYNIKSGKILLNNNTVKPSAKLNIGDKIKIKDEVWKEKKIELLPNKKIKLNIVFENEDFIVINKPAGVLVHPVTEKDHNTLVNGLIYLYPEIIGVGEDLLRPGIVHRIDKDTSGLLLIAKNKKSFKSFKNKFKKRKIYKSYLALVFGKLNVKKGVINTPITRSKSKFNRRKISNTNEGKEAITEYEVIREYKDASLLKVSIKTGRTHQIRVHFASLSNFVLGDKEYGSNKINNKYGFKRQFLHACEIGFTYKRKKYHFQTELPSDLKKVLKNIP